MELNPLVSIIIPVYNGANFMREAIDSALAQTYKNIEILVINDGSTDNTEEIALSYGEKIKYFKKENGGQSTALNFGIERMNGEYFSWLSHDDVYYPNKVEYQVTQLLKFAGQKIILYSDYDMIDSHSTIISEGKAKDTSPERFRLQLLLSSPINGCAALIPKEAFSESVFFNTKRPHTSDVEAFFNMAATYKFIHSANKLIKSRIHSGQMTHKKANYHKYESNLFLIDSLKKMSDDEFAQAGEHCPEVYLKIATNWAGRGYKKAYKLALKEYKGKSKSIQFSVIVKLKVSYLRKTLKTKLKYLIFKFKKW